MDRWQVVGWLSWLRPARPGTPLSMPLRAWRDYEREQEAARQRIIDAAHKDER